MTDKEDALGPRLLARLDQATDRNQRVINNNKKAIRHLDSAMPVIDRTLQGNEIALRAIREVYGVIEEATEELSTTKVELKQARDGLEVSNNFLEQAGFDFANIQTFSNEVVWLAEHLPTIKRALEIFNLPKAEQALVDIKASDPDRFEALKALFEKVAGIPQEPE